MDLINDDFTGIPQVDGILKTKYRVWQKFASTSLRGRIAAVARIRLERRNLPRKLDNSSAHEHCRRILMSSNWNNVHDSMLLSTGQSEDDHGRGASKVSLTKSGMLCYK